MSLRSRLIWSLSVSFVLLWLLVAALMYLYLEKQVAATLDQRLAASANMVAGLVAGKPELLLAPADNPLLLRPESDGVACQIRAANGEVLLQTDSNQGAALVDARPGFSTVAIAGELWRLFTLNQNGMLITVADRMAERSALEDRIILAMVVPFALALLGTLPVLWWGVSRGLQPINRLHRELQRRDPGNLEPLTVRHTPDELQPLLTTLNTLFARLERAMAREQRFASNAAHEFRTPLTGIKTHLQVARRLQGSQQHVALDNAEKGVARLQNVTEQLLMLSRLEQSDEWREFQPSTLHRVIAQALTDLPGRERIDCHISQPGQACNVPPALVIVALRNLLDNALKYSTDIAAVSLSAEPEKTNSDLLCFTVSDGGYGWTGSGSQVNANRRLASHDSHGLGLTIVETIASQFHGRLSSEHNARGGMDWLLVLPLVKA